MGHFKTGQSGLQAFLKKNSFAIRDLSLEEFREFVQKEVEWKQGDETFRTRWEIREIKREHRQKFSVLGAQLDRARKGWEQSPLCGELERIERDLQGAELAVAGLTKSVKKSGATKKITRGKKLGDFTARLKQLKVDRQKIIENSPEFQAFQKAQKELDELKKHLGLNPLEKKLEKLLFQQGHRSSRAGKSFETRARQQVQDWIIPQVRRTKSPQILSQVTLGCARAELDYLVVDQENPEKEVTVLAMVEVKRNLNDVVWGFSMRQENLAWFSNHSPGYDPAQYKTNIFKEGHFDRSVTHKEKKQSFVFGPNSFEQFSQNSKGYFMDGLFFITEERYLKGMTNGEYSRFLYRLATDLDFDPDDLTYLEGLFEWTKSILGPLNTRDVLTMYAEEKSWGNQFLILKKNR